MGHVSTSIGASAVADVPAEQRAQQWQRLARRKLAHGEHGPALVAALTARAIWHEMRDDDGLAAASVLVAGVDGETARWLEVDTAQSPAAEVAGDLRARATWIGAPAATVLAMLGWIENAGELHVVRVVVPGTLRGHRAWRELVACLPHEVGVSLQVPARDRALLRITRAAGFTVDPAGAVSLAGVPAATYVGGTEALVRPPS